MVRDLSFPGENKTAIKIFLVEDDILYRQALKRLLRNKTQFKIIAEAENIEQAWAFVGKDSLPDVMLVDLTLKDGNGLDLIAKVHKKHKQLPILMISAADERDFAERAIQVGAMGYLMKPDCTDFLIDAIHRVVQGNIYLSHNMTTGLVKRALVSKPQLELRHILSDRELEILHMISEGESRREISSKLKIAESTVDTYKNRIKAKVGVHSNKELIAISVDYFAKAL